MTSTGHVKVGVSQLLIIEAATTLVANEYDTVVALITDAVALTLPTLASCVHGYKLTISNRAADVDALTVTAVGTNYIGSSGTTLTQAVAQNESYVIVADRKNSRWQVVSGPA